MNGMQSAGSQSPRYNIVFPQIDHHEEQDAEYCEIELSGRRRVLRLHDYDEIYKIPGLYEQLFADRLKCASPARVIRLLAQALDERGIEPWRIGAIDVGAGNGMVGQELRRAGIASIVGVDIIPEARDAALRDRPGLYRDYVVADLTKLRDAERARLLAVDPALMVTVAALGFGDIPPRAFAAAFNLVSNRGWVAFNIRDSFLRNGDRSGFSRLVADMASGEIIRIEAWKRYVHRLSVHGRAIEYVAIVARKLREIPERLLEPAVDVDSTSADTDVAEFMVSP